MKNKNKRMQRLELEQDRFKSFTQRTCVLSGALLAFWIAGCGGSSPSTVSPTTPQQGPQAYFAPAVVGTTNEGSPLTSFGPEIYAIDDSTDPHKFSQTIVGLQPPVLQGSQVINAGTYTSSQRGLLSLDITVNYTYLTTGKYTPTTFDPVKTGSFAVELAGQAGGLVQLVGQPATPLVAATQCPNLTTAQTYQFITIPGALTAPSTNQPHSTWDATNDTAYGSVDISSKGSAVTFSNIHQFTLASSGAPAQPASSPATGACQPTTYGNTISVPGQLLVTAPGNGSVTPPQATVAVGPTGLLVEDNGTAGTTGSLPDTMPALPYNNVLGAGMGAIGLPKPSGPLDTAAMTGAQYLGFTYSAGTFSGGASRGWTSHLTSFGFAGYPTLPSACSTFAAQTGPLVNGIYGGDFPQKNGQDDPSSSSDGFGKCDLAVDLGTQDDSGLFTHVKVWLGSSYAANTTGSTYFFQAVAVAGQLNGKNAIFVLGVDATQPWAIYLLQSK